MIEAPPLIANAAASDPRLSTRVVEDRGSLDSVPLSLPDGITAGLVGWLAA